MRGFVPPDPETRVSDMCYAVIHTPNRERRRFSAGLVRIVESAETALRQARARADCHAAQVLGPSKSSEGQYLYYLVEWLDEVAGPDSRQFRAAPLNRPPGRPAGKPSRAQGRRPPGRAG